MNEDGSESLIDCYRILKTLFLIDRVSVFHLVHKVIVFFSQNLTVINIIRRYFSYNVFIQKKANKRIIQYFKIIDVGRVETST